MNNCRAQAKLTLFGAALLAIVFSTHAAEPPVSLQVAFQDHFLIGAAVNRGMVSGGAAFRRTAEQTAADVALLKQHFNQITAENDMKWAVIHPREGQGGYNFGPADSFVSFGLSNRMYLVGHTLVWHNQTPDWVFAGTNTPPSLAGNAPENAGRPNGTRNNVPRASREVLLERIREHIQTVVGRYKGKIQTWDVVNEAIADGDGTNVLRNTLWLEIIGPDYIAKAFHYAHEADPDAILRFNDYGLENPVKRRKLITLVRSLQEQGVPIHAIGSQAHVNVSITFQTMDEALAELKISLGLPIHITELDVNSAAGGQRRTDADIAANASATQGGLVAQADERQARA